MARSDLLINLVKATSAGDQRLARSTIEAIIAEENAKQHYLLADELRRAMNGYGKGSPSPQLPVDDSAGKGKALVTEIIPRRQFDDLVLEPATLRACQQLVEEQHRADLLRSHGPEPRHRVLLVGPPGNGKTSLAEAVATELATPFLIVRYDAIIGSYLGETAGRLRRVFDYVKTNSCVLFFDDLMPSEKNEETRTKRVRSNVSSHRF